MLFNNRFLSWDFIWQMWTQRGRPKRTYIDFIDEVLQKVRVCSTRVYDQMLNVDAARGVCKDRNR